MWRFINLPTRLDLCYNYTVISGCIYTVHNMIFWVQNQFPVLCLRYCLAYLGICFIYNTFGIPVYTTQTNSKYKHTTIIMTRGGGRLTINVVETSCQRKNNNDRPHRTNEYLRFNGRSTCCTLFRVLLQMPMLMLLPLPATLSHSLHRMSARTSQIQSEC